MDVTIYLVLLSFISIPSLLVSSSKSRYTSVRFFGVLATITMSTAYAHIWLSFVKIVI